MNTSTLNEKEVLQAGHIPRMTSQPFSVSVVLRPINLPTPDVQDDSHRQYDPHLQEVL